jgi:hypothetical protein
MTPKDKRREMHNYNTDILPIQQRILDIYNEIIDSVHNDISKKDYSKLEPQAVFKWTTIDQNRKSKKGDEHGSKFTEENFDAADKSRLVQEDIDEEVIEKILERLGKDDFNQIAHAIVTDQSPDGFDMPDELTPEEIEAYTSSILDEVDVDDAVYSLLEKAQKAQKLKSMYQDKMPDKLYRGQASGNPESNGFGIHDKYSEDPEDYITFLADNPAKAASYGHENPFGTLPDQTPQNYSNEIYEILTQGLDPDLFIPDTSATAGEIEHAPQYKYLDKIKQELIKIIDQSGTEREVPRISLKHFPSDSRVKNITSAINRRY